ncbi:C40 family peptidase [Brevibacterium album]|uniref:C40 family peptidase n=1 Tax=Brevibacterium album TaxID=417948 RepID=UPI00048D5AAF|nr:C40 family peptidase [Brevibacterium album]
MRAKALLPALGVCALALTAQPALASTTAPGASGAASPQTMAGGADDGGALRLESDGELKKGDTAFVSVTTATVWSEKDSPRKVDEPALGASPDLRAWDRALDRSTETRRGLTGLVETQAGYGSEVEILEVDGSWAQVAVVDQETPKSEDGYPGWVPTAQLVENDRFAELREDQPAAVVTAKSAELADVQFAEFDGDAPTAPINAELPLIAQDEDDVRVALPAGGAAWIAIGDVRIEDPDHGFELDEPTGADLVETARQFEGVDYLWGGVSPLGFDCSGFTYTVFRAHGIEIPRDAGDQQNTGRTVSSTSLEAGDLLFFARGGSGRAHHVGMYIGDGKMIHAPNASKDVEVVDWQSWDRGGQFAGAKRHL